MKHIFYLSMSLVLLFVTATAARAQGSDGLYVIKKGNHYLAHVKVDGNWVLRDATAFDTTCLWYSGREFNVMGTTHNYYFVDDQHKYRFLSAPLQANGDLTLSASLPEVYLLNNTDHNYYFYDWDPDEYGRGLARGHQYNGVANTSECTACGGSWYNGQCWEVYWVEYHADYTPVQWRLSSASDYHITTDAARFRPVEVTVHPRVDTPTSGGLTDLNVPATMEWGDAASTLSATPNTISSYTYSYVPAYTEYAFEGVTHYYYSNSDHLAAPGSQSITTSSPSYAWSISEEGEGFLTLTGANTATPTLAYSNPITDGHRSVTVTLTVTYNDNATQTLTATVLVKAQCQNPAQASAPVVNYGGVTVSWKATADKYKLEWTKESDATWASASSVSDLTRASYTITDFEYGTNYSYRVTAYCGDDYLTPSETGTGSFSTLSQPEAFIGGAVFGGGRMANVTGKTEVVIINADSISAVYGGNDIAGVVEGADGSTIVLGVNAGDSYSTTYNSGVASTKVRVGDVYGGGNGYYAYNGTSFVAATATTVGIPASTSVMALSPTNQWNIPVWDNPKTDGDSTMTLPAIVKTSITMTNDVVKVDSVFGGAKNAFITNTADDDGTNITVNGGTAFAVYGGNNYGGSQAGGKHIIAITNTKTNTETYPTGFGRDFGIAYLFGGGNKVEGKTTEVVITGGMCDTVFGGGNAADVAASNVTVNCSIASGDAPVFGNTYSRAISSYSSGITINSSYDWDGTGIYNVRTLFGGNNRADMAGLPIITLTSGSVGTVYGGGNAGDMLAQTPDDVDPTTNPGTGPLALDFDPPMVGSDKKPIYYGTHVVMDQANMIVDYLYGGCQMSDVKYSTWVEIKNGHVGTVYGGCNVSGDVGSEPRLTYSSTMSKEEYQLVNGGTYVKATGGTIYGDLFAGSNGFYHCNDGVHYIEGHNYTSHNYVGDTIPSHNETHVKVSKDATAGTSALVKGNVYAGGNMAYVGFINETDQGYRFRDFVGFCSVRMDGGTVEGSVYGGGNRASVFGSNEVKVSGGMIGYTVIDTTATDGALYGGNDRAGQVAQISNRVLPDSYSWASDGSGRTNLKLLGVKTYVSVTDKPKIFTVYGGGNGAYTDYNFGNYCDPTDKPVQSNTFVDININAQPDAGQTQGGYINTVYGGGNGVTVLDRITVFVNVDNAAANAYDQVGTIFGGNNQGNLDILSDIILLHGQVNTVYGGCNSGAMTGSHTYEDYYDVGSVVQLRNEYRPNGTGSPVVPDAKVTSAVYGGCRMNDVTNNSLVLVEGGTHTACMFGGCDISGIVGNTSRVVVKNGTSISPDNSTVIGNVYGGGNGDYDYIGNNVYVAGSDHDDPANLIATSTANILRPASNNTRVDMVSGTADNLYGGGNACGVTNTSTVNMNGGQVTAGLYGGCCSLDTIHGDVTVNVLGGTVGTDAISADIFGGGYGQHTRTDGNVEVNFGDASHAPTLYGDIYGGSAFGHVNDTMVNGVSAHTTTVNVLNGTVNGDIYGGGLGQKAGGGQPAIAALVQGKTYVNIGATTGGNNPTYSGNATITGDVYGCNNLNGTPMDSVFVNIYKTAHVTTPENNFYPSEPGGGWDVAKLATNASTQAYAINAVYGGGNQAAYTPSLTSDDNPRQATVHVYDCQSNTVQYVFGGGNAADVGYVTGSDDTVHANTLVIIDGGRIHQAFGGGNGAGVGNPGANIHGIARSEIYAGLIDEVFGGANMRGSVDVIDLNVESSSGCDKVYGKVFGCANWAPYNKSVTTTIYCGVGTIGELYGGSNMAAIGDPDHPNTGVDVTLNLFGGGPYDNVFAGSKGVRNGQAAPIYGNVTLNLYGGTATRAFGGSDQNGNITGTVTVNVLDFEDCPLKVDSIFGASNLAEYAPLQVNSENRTSPIINMMHVKGGDPTNHNIGNIFGGGNKAAVTNANPQVNIGYDASTMSDIISATPITYPTTSTFYTDAPRGYVSNSVFGGGNEAGVTGNPVINMRHYGTVVTGIYGGCNTNGIVVGDINVNIYGGTLGTSTSAMMPDGIFGGGKGNLTGTNGNVTVTIDKETDEASAPIVYADIYGGSAFGEVGADSPAPTLAKVDLKNGTVYGNMFGGGKGDGTYTAMVTGNSQVAIEGGNALANIFGGCNVKGIVAGNAIISITGGILGAAASGTPGDPGYVAEIRANAYGGGLGENTKVKGNVNVTVDGSTAVVYGDVYGGSAKGLVNCNDAGNGATPGSETTVTLSAGTIHGDLYGGGHGLESHNADVWGPVTVTVQGGTVDTVFGGNNLSGTPKSSIEVNVNDGVANTVVGGGNRADYTAPVNPSTSKPDYPEVNISGGVVTFKVVGGGNRANIIGNPHIEICGGHIGTDTLASQGVYGGCNTSGTVTGNTCVTLTGGTIGGYGAKHGASIFGGGYGAGTSVSGNVVVTFGDSDDDKNEFPKLYGDLYGGSALGNVNSSSSNTTTVYVYNGTITGPVTGQTNEDDNIRGNVFGGGLGDKDDATKGRTLGNVYVYIGSETKGLATLSNCNVFGCNNTNGSPQDSVHVHVYHTGHTKQDEAGYFESDRSYAIYQVFGGGNHANYAPDNGNESYETMTKVIIHGCDNTVKYVYGGCNAAHALNVETIVEGGRFNQIYGGGNGIGAAADIIGPLGIGLNVLSGNVTYIFEGSNKNGINRSNNFYKPAATTSCTGGLFVDSYYFGTNEAEYFGDLENAIPCDDASSFEYRNVFASSRWGIVYGDIKFTVGGGIIENLFGGGQGEEHFPADIRRFPSPTEISAKNAETPGYYSDSLITFVTNHPEMIGHGGNITLIVNGGTIGNIYGGCDYKGNVEGTISVTVNNAEEPACPLFVGNVYGANNRWFHKPLIENSTTPVVQVLKGIIGGSSPYLPVNNISGFAPTEYEGNVFGGGNYGDVNANPSVIVGDGTNTSTVSILGDVYGGCNEGDVDGSPNVVIVPAIHTLKVTAPSSPDQIEVLNSVGTDVTNDAISASGITVGEGLIVTLKAKPDVARSFVHWTITEEGSSPINVASPTYSYFMGTKDCTIVPVFSTPATTYNLTLTSPSNGKVVVKDAQGNDRTSQLISLSGLNVAEGTVLNIEATPNCDKTFSGWTVSTAEGGVFGKARSAKTTFTMRHTACTITANFSTPATTYNLTLTSPSNGLVEVLDAQGDDKTSQLTSSGLTVAKGAVFNITATANTDYAFVKWSVPDHGLIANENNPVTTFTVGDGNAQLEASFQPVHKLYYSEYYNDASTAESHGTVKITNAMNQAVATGDDVGKGALIKLKAVPMAGYAFKNWILDSSPGPGEDGGTIVDANAAFTTFTMGDVNATIHANFVNAHTLTVAPSEHGTVKISNIHHMNVSSPVSLGENATVTVVATPASGYRFDGWTVTEATTGAGIGGATITPPPDNATATFTMGTKDVTLTAIFIATEP